MAEAAMAGGPYRSGAPPRQYSSGGQRCGLFEAGSLPAERVKGKRHILPRDEGGSNKTLYGWGRLLTDSLRTLHR